MFRVAGLGLLIVSATLAVEPLVLRSEALPNGALRRFGIPPQPAAQPVRAGGHTAYGSLWVLVAHDREIVVWAWEPVGSKSPAKRLTGAKAPLTQLVLSADVTTALAADTHGGLHVWDIATGKYHEVRAKGDTVTALALDAGGEQVFFAAGKTLHVYERATQTTRALGTRPATITTLAVQDNTIAVADAKGQITLRNRKGEHVADLPWTAIPNKPDPNAKPQPFLGFGGGKLAKENPQEPLQYVHEFERGIKKLVFSPDGKYVAAAGGTVVRVWNRSNNKLVWEHNRHASINWGVSLAVTNYIPPPRPPQQVGAVWDIAFSRDGKCLASSGVHNDVLLLHTDTGKDVRTVQPFAVEAKRRERAYFTGRHELAFGPDGQTLTTFEGSIGMVQEELLTGQVRNRVASHRAVITGVAISPDEKWLATMGDDRRVRLWNLERGEGVDDVAAGHGEGQGMSFSPDGRWLCTGGAYHGFSVWQVSGTPPQLSMKDGYDTLRYQGMGFVAGEAARVVGVGQYGASRLVDLADRKQHAFPYTPNADVRSFSTDGKIVALAFGASSSPSPQLFDLQGKPGPRLEGIEFEWYIDRVRLSADGRFLFGAGRDGYVVWETTTGKQYLSGLRMGTVHVAAFSKDSRVLALGVGPHIHLVELATGRTLRTIRADSRYLLALQFTAKGLVSGGSDGVAYWWDVAKELQHAAPLPKNLGVGLAGHGATTGLYAKRYKVRDHVFSVAFAPDGHTLAVGSRDVIQLFDTRTDKETATLAADQGYVMDLAYSPDGKSLAACGQYFDGKALPVRMYDTATNKQRWAKANTGRQPLNVRFSPDSATLFTAGHGVCRWEVATGTELARLKLGDRYALAVAVAPDGERLVVSGMTADVLVFDPKNPRGSRILQGSDARDEGNTYMHAVAYAADGSRIATGGRDGLVRIWDGKDFTKLVEWQTTSKQYRGVATVVFNPKGTLLAVAGGPIESGLLHDIDIYDVKTGALRVRLFGDGPRVAWSPDGRWLATAERHWYDRKDKHVLLWDMEQLLGK